MADGVQQALDREDWRHFAIEKFGEGTRSIATEEKLSDKSVVGFSLPSAPALFLNMSLNAYRNRSAVDVGSLFDKHSPPQGTYPDNHTPLFDYYELATAEIIFSYSAVEAAVNEMIPDNYAYERRAKGGSKLPAISKDDIERKIPLQEKLKKVLPDALNKPSPAGGSLWPPFIQLEALRDQLIHLKSIDRKASGPDDETIWGRLLRMEGINCPEAAANIIGHFYSSDRRWFQIRPTS